MAERMKVGAQVKEKLKRMNRQTWRRIGKRSKGKPPAFAEGHLGE